METTYRSHKTIKQSGIHRNKKEQGSKTHQSRLGPRDETEKTERAIPSRLNGADEENSWNCGQWQMQLCVWERESSKSCCYLSTNDWRPCVFSTTQCRWLSLNDAFQSLGDITSVSKVSRAALNATRALAPRKTTKQCQHHFVSPRQYALSNLRFPKRRRNLNPSLATDWSHGGHRSIRACAFKKK